MTAYRTCASCDTPAGLTPQGLCGRCQEELRFVTRPSAHRETYRREIAAQATLRQEWEQRRVVVISSVPAGNDLWICDFCNDQIPVDGEHTLIPLIGSYALCTPCVTRIPYWPDAWTQPTPRACPCDACQTPLHSLTPHRRTGRGLDDDTRRNPGIGR